MLIWFWDSDFSTLSHNNSYIYRLVQKPPYKIIKLNLIKSKLVFFFFLLKFLTANGPLKSKDTPINRREEKNKGNLRNLRQSPH